MSGDEMLLWLIDNGARNGYGALDYDTAKEIAHFSDYWVLQHLDPKTLGDWSFPPETEPRRLPIVVGVSGDHYEVLDGKHRVAEANSRGDATIPAYVGKFFGDAQVSESADDDVDVAAYIKGVKGWGDRFLVEVIEDGKRYVGYYATLGDTITKPHYHLAFQLNVPGIQAGRWVVGRCLNRRSEDGEWEISFASREGRPIRIWFTRETPIIHLAGGATSPGKPYMWVHDFID